MTNATPAARLVPVPDEPPSGSTRAVGAAHLVRTLEAHRGGRHVVLLRGYPDPDSLASAWAHQRIAASLGIECDIAHVPIVSRPENRAMVNLLDIPLVRLASPEDLGRYSAVSLVDTHHVDPSGPPRITIVDHHTAGEPVEAPHVDIRPHVGSTSTIYTEYLIDGRFDVLRSGELATRLATALAYGMRSDTDDLLRATPEDLRALASLVDLVDPDVLAALSRYAIAATSMTIIRRALESMQVEGTWAVAGVGQVRSQDRDAIGQAADFLLRRDGIRTVIAFGVVDAWIDGSLRTNDPSIDPAEWLRDAFGVGPNGVPYGGGRRGKGGFQLPLGALAACPNPTALWQVAKETVEHVIRERIGAS